MANLFFFGLLWVITISATFCDDKSLFKPKLQWICIPSGMLLTIKTVEPFNGIANAVGYQENCTSVGHGQTNTYMVIDFDDGDQCGVKYENQTETYWVEVEVHESNVLVSEHYAIFNVTCDNSSSMSYDPLVGFSLDLYPYPLNNGTETTDHPTNAENGQNYVLHAFLESSDDSIKYLNHFLLTSCFVEGDEAVEKFEIIDSHGCSTDLKHISDVEYDNGYAKVNLSSINPYLKFAKLKCKFSICENNETCRQSCQRHWYDSALKRAKIFANWIGFNTTTTATDDVSQELSPPPAIIDPFISCYDKLNDRRRETIVQLLVLLQTDALPSKSSQSSFFIDKCYKIDFYFYVFEQCCSFDEIYLLYVFIVVEWVIMAGLIFLNLFQCYRRVKAGKVGYTNDEDYFVFDKTGDKDDEKLVREKSFLRRISKRRRASVKSDEIYATIKSRSSTRPQKINSISQIYDNPYITMPSFFKPPNTNDNEHIYAGSSIEENPTYICQKNISYKNDICNTFI